MIKIKRLIALLNDADLTPQSALEKAVKSALAAINGRIDDGAPLEATGVMSTNGSGKEVITLDKTAAELFAAAQAGRLLRVTTELTFGEGQDAVTATATNILPFVASKLEAGGESVYGFAAHPDTDGEDKMFCVDNLAADDTVVLTEATAEEGNDG